MKKVLLFQDYFASGGIEKVILDIKNNLDNKYDISILSIVNKSNENIISLTNKDYRKFAKRFLCGFRKYKENIKKNNYDIIHIHCYNSFGLIYAFIAKKYCKNIIVHAHNSEIDSDFLYVKHIVNYLVRFLFKSKKYVYIAVSDKCNKFCFNYKNTIIINNGIDYSKYYFSKKERDKYRKQFNIKDDEIVIGHIGRYEKQKNHDFIIDIFNEICSLKSNYRLILIGDGLLLEKIKEKVNLLKIESKVIFLSNRNDISRLINMFDIYLFPSIYEGFGLSLLENEVNGKYSFISDNIPKDVIVSNRVNVISLNKKANYWAKEIIDLKEKKLVLDNRLEITEFINKVDDIYRGFYDKN